MNFLKLFLTAFIFSQAVFVWPSADLSESRPAEAEQSPTANIPLSGTRPSEIGPALSPEMANSIRRVKLPENVKLIALTFDLCETEKAVSGYDAAVVDYLRANKIRATFFANGKWMRSHPEKTMQLMVDPLFEIGNHGWDHRNFRRLDGKEAENQVLLTQAQYEMFWEEMQKGPFWDPAAEEQAKKIPRVPRVFRFPFGACNPDALKMLQGLGLPAIQWDVVSGDPAKGRTAESIAMTVLRSARPGSIIVFHANGRGHGTAGSLPMFVPRLRKAGFDFVTVSELLASGVPVAVPECYEMKPGDNFRYDSR